MELNPPCKHLYLWKHPPPHLSPQKNYYREKHINIKDL